ncbi:hypothetical protein [Yoonia sp. 2307UL14-13]|uniref:hypothetical protein n=1 Tax=Yoonia sp. 2307UL14-13 TaxID=3126506 RepID=UPI0030AC5F6D
MRPSRAGGARQTLGRCRPGLGSLSTFIGIALIGLTFTRAGDDITALGLSASLALVGLGMGLSNVALMSNALALVSNGIVGAASSLLQTGQQIGITLSIAIFGGLYFAHTSSATSEAVAAALLFRGAAFAAASLLCRRGAITHTKRET